MGGNRYREIKISDLFVHICQRWRFILVCIIIGVIVVGGVGAYKIGKSTDSVDDNGVSVETGLSAKEKLTVERQKNVEAVADSIIHYSSLRDSQKEFNGKSMYMSLDPYKLNTGEMRYYVDNYQSTEWNNQLSAIIQSYTMFLRSDEFAQLIQQLLTNNFGEEKCPYAYYKDLVYIDTSLQDKGIFVVLVYGNTDDEVLELVRIVKETILEKYIDVTDNTGEHTLTILGESIYTTFNSIVKDNQTTYVQNVTDYNNKINNLKSSITDANEKIYLEYLLEVNEETQTNIDEPETITETSGLTIRKASMSISGKYVGIGAILGLIIAIILIIIKYVATSVIKTHDELEKYLNIPVLTRMDGDSDFSRKHKTSFDKWLRKKKLRHRHNMSYEENVDLVAAKIEIATTKNNLKNICIATDLDCDEKYAKDIIAKLNGKVETIYIKNFLAKADALQNLSQTDGVVLIEQTEISKYQDIVEEIQLCSKYDINVIGAIVLE